MGIYIDPATRQRVVYDQYCGDIRYLMQGDPAITQETVPVIGPWQDYTGSDLGVNSQSQQQFAGISNQLEGTDPAITDNARVGPLGIVGQNVQTTRRRTILKTVNISKQE